MSFHNAKIKSVGVNPLDYHQPQKRGGPEFVMSSSALRAFWACPSKWVEPIVAEDGAVSYYEFAGSKSTEYGNLFDCLLLRPEQFDRCYAVRPATYLCESGKDKGEEKPWNNNATVCKEWNAEQAAAGRETLSARDFYAVRQAVKRFLREPEFDAWLKYSDKQVWVTAEWRDEPTGMVIPCQCLIDLAPKEDAAFDPMFFASLADVKTTKNARVVPWEKWCHAAGYEVQAAWNTDLFAAATGRDILNFCFLLSENEAPYQVGRRRMAQDLLDPAQDVGDIASGRRQYRKALADYCTCLKTGKWPGYDDTDEASGGWTLVSPNPYAEQARMFAPRYNFEEESEPEEAEPVETGEVTP